MGTTVHVNDDNDGDDKEAESQSLISKAAGLTGYVPDDVLEGLSIVDSLVKFDVYCYKNTNGQNSLMAKFHDRFPDPGPDLGEKFGGGDYLLRITWPDPLSKGKNKTQMKTVKVSIGAHYDEIAAEKKREEKNVGKFGEMKEILSAVKEMMPVPAPANGSQTEIFRLMMDNQARSEARMEKLMDASRAETRELIRAMARPQKSMQETMLENLQMFKMMKETFGGNETSNPSEPWWQFLISTVSEKLETVFQIVNEQSKIKQIAMVHKVKDFGRIKQAFVQLQSNTIEQQKAVAALKAQVGDDPKRQEMLSQVLRAVKLEAEPPHTTRPMNPLRRQRSTPAPAPTPSGEA